MAHKSSEQIAHAEARKQLIQKWLMIIVPTGVFLALVLMIFVDSRAIVLGYTFFVIAALAFVFTVGAGKKPRKVKVIKDYSVRTIRPGAGGPHSDGGYDQFREQSQKAAQSYDHSVQERYEDMRNQANAPVIVVATKGGNDPKNQKGQQSKAGENLSNGALVALLVVAVIVLWLFGGSS